jgi:hypothetical protein
VFTRGAFNVNMIAIRSATEQVNSFDDQLHLVYRDDFGQWVDLAFRCTTDPGLYWLEHPIRRDGTAILKCGQYRGAYKIGLHRGSYPALVQRKPVTVWRDRNKDETIDLVPGSEVTGLFGINIHHAGEDSQQVDKWSAGCTVIANLNDWSIFWSVINRSADRYGETFTYTLIKE